MTEKYYSIFYPLKDLYELAGREAFYGFEGKEGKKNLVLMTSQIDKKNSGEGGLDAINFLEESAIKKSENGISIYKISERLDIAYINNGEFDEKNLKKLVSENWKSAKEVEVVTQDSKEILKYRSYSFNCEKPRFLIPEEGIVNKGIILGNKELHAELYNRNRKISLEQAKEILEIENLYHNQFVKFKGDKGYEYAKVSGEIIRNKRGDRILEIKNPILALLNPNEYQMTYKIGEERKDNMFGIKPRDIEQYLAVQHAILNPDVELAFICGSQGSGKTLLSYTAAVDLILNYDTEIAKKRKTPFNRNSFFKNIILLKPNNFIGNRDIGFLPGNIWQKEKPHLAPFIDAHQESELDFIPFLEMILHPKRANDFGNARSESISNKKINKQAYLPPNTEAIKIESSGFLRGRTFTGALILVDEAQNFTPYEMNTIIGRTGPDTKCIIMGDPNQFDNQYCSKNINGLTSAIKHFLPKPQTMLIKLNSNYRSQSSQDTLEWKVFSDS
jgi:predicted ribonuclease YlaK